MKKALAILALVTFLGGMGAPAIAQINSSNQTITLADEDPKKAKKSEKKSAECDSKKAEKAPCESACESKCESASETPCETDTKKKK